MNFRVNVAVACAAALSFACADKPAAIPELEEALNAPPGTQVVGLYRMDVTPVAGSDGRQLAFVPIPVGRDGNPLTNPANTVQVGGTFGGVVNQPLASATVNCPVGVPTLSAPVTMTNFSVDTLTGIWADVLTVMPTGFLACNSNTGAVPVEVGSTNDGAWRYLDLAGVTTAAPGTVAGGTDTRTWQFRYPGVGSFVFYFRVLANVATPSPNPSTNVPLWFSNQSNVTNLEICTADPGLAVQAPCPGTSTLVPNVTSLSAVAPFQFSHTPALPNGTYWYRAANFFAAAGAASPYFSGWNTFTVAPAAAPPTVQTAISFLANDPNALLEWTTDAATLETYYFLCDGSCAAPTPIILAEGPVLASDFAQPDPRWPTLNYYAAAPLFALDPLTSDGFSGLYWLPTTAGAYELRVFNYDGFFIPAPTDAGAAIGTTGITPVGIVPTNLAPPAGTISAAATTFSWNTDPLIGSTTVDFFDVTDPLLPLFIGQDIVLGTAGAYSLPAATAGAPTTLAAWLAGQPTTPIEVQLFNTDLYGTVSVLVRTYNMNP